jgi:sugar lactone lactonase YvrE
MIEKWKMITLATLCSLAMSCGTSDETRLVKVTGVEVLPTTLELLEGTDSTLVATVLPDNADDKRVTWRTGDPAVVSVEEGKVSALQAGGPVKVTVTTRDGVKSATCLVTVTALPVELKVSTFAGSGTPGSQNAMGTAAQFSNPQGIVVDAEGNIYVGEDTRVRKITPAGMVTTLAGAGANGYLDGTGTAAYIQDAAGMDIDSRGNLYVAAYANYCVRKITPEGVVTTIAGNGTAGYLDGIGTAAEMGAVGDVLLDPSGEILYVTDGTNHCIRKVVLATGEVTTFAGNGTEGYVDATGTDARLAQPRGMTMDAEGNLYVIEYMSHRLRKVTPAGVVTTFAGSGEEGHLDGPAATATFSYPVAATMDAEGNIYISDTGNRCIRRITPDGEVSTFAGVPGERGLLDGPALTALFDSPFGIAINADGVMFVCDRFRPCIRRIAIE